MSDRPAGARTRPPLSGVPGGVISFQRGLPGGRANSCQKLLFVATEPPITATAQVPAAVARDVARNGAPAGGASGAGARAAGAALPQPAMSAADTRATAAAAGRAGLLMSAPAAAARRRSARRRTTT